MIQVPRTYRYVIEDRDRHGNVRVYLRQPGKPKIRLHEEPGTPEFDAEYRQALDGKAKPTSARAPKPPAGSLRALCEAYYASADCKRLDPRSRHVRRLILDKLCDQHGDKPAALMEARHVRQIRDARADAPEAANSIVKALRAVFRQGMLADLVTRNPARDVEYLRSGGEGFHTWTADEVAQFEARHPIGTKARLALALLLYTGQRRSDVVLLGRQHLKDGWLTFVQTKNRVRKPVRLSIPMMPTLKEIIDATPGVSGALSFLATDRGTAYNPDAFGNLFRAWCREAGLPHCSAHGLRKAAASRLAEAGATTHEIAAITGHRSLKEVQRYTQGAQQKRMAASAFARLDGNKPRQNSPTIPATSEEWDENDPQRAEKKGAK